MSDTNDMCREFEAWLNSSKTANGYDSDLFQSWQAATERATASQWQDIATAPRDTTSILVFSNNFIYEAWYSQQWGKFVKSETGGTHGINPTHWMPLPPQPAIRQGGAT